LRACRRQVSLSRLVSFLIRSYIAWDLTFAAFLLIYGIFIDHICCLLLNGRINLIILIVASIHARTIGFVSHKTLWGFILIRHFNFINYYKLINCASHQQL
jgi:hypothetical protein